MPCSKKTWTDKKQLKWIRGCVVGCALFMLYWGMMYQGSDDVWDYLAITGAIYFTGAIPVIIGGLYWKKATSAGAIVSIIAGFTALLGFEPIRKEFHITISSAEIGIITVGFTDDANTSH